MKRLVLLVCFLMPLAIVAQDHTWFDIVTSQVGLDSARGARIVVADINGDHYPDLIWGTGNLNKNRFGVMLNISNPNTNSPIKRVFRDFTEESNINQNRDPNKTGRIADVAALADVDNDGDIDLVTSVYYHRLEMYRGANDPGDRTELLLNDGSGKFALFEASGLNKIKLVDTLPEGLVNCTGLAFLDYDYDGKIDLYMSTWFADYKSNLEINNFGYKMRDALLKGNGDGTFTLLSLSGVEANPQPNYGVNITDWNNDGWLDIITSPYCRSGGALLRNNKNGTFSDVATSANYTAQYMGGDHNQALCQWEAQPGDYNNDGLIDLIQVQVHGGANDGEGRTHVAKNTLVNGKFSFVRDMNQLERKVPIESTHFGDDGATWIDLNSDMKLDVIVGQIGYDNKDQGVNVDGQPRAYFLLQDGKEQFLEITDLLGLIDSLPHSHSVEPCDFDLDGDQDILISHQVRDTVLIDGVKTPKEYMQIELLLNNYGNSKNFISVKLYPPANSNMSAIGSRIYVYSDTITQIREVQAGIGHFSGQQPLIQNFGLADKQVDSIVVRWSNSELKTTTIKFPPTNVIAKIGEIGLFNYITPSYSSEYYSLIGFDSPRLNISKTNVGDTAEKTCKIWNYGTNLLTITSFELLSEFPEVFNGSEFGKELPISVYPNEFVEFKVKFSPLMRNLYNCKVKFNTDAVNSRETYLEVSAFGFEEKPILSALNQVAFPPTWFTTNHDTTIVVTNTGELDLNISNVLFDDNSAFSMTTGLPLVIEPNQSKTLNVRFAPDSLGSFVSRMKIISNAYNSQEFEIELSGNCDGPAPNLTLSNNTIAFLTVAVDAERSRSITLSNEGNSTLNVSEIYFDEFADVYKIDKVPPFAIEQNMSETLNITFAPKEIKNYNTKLNIISDNFSAKKLVIDVSGAGKKSTSVEDCSDCVSFIANISPNPSNGIILLDIKNDYFGPSKIYLKLYDLTGKLVATDDLATNGSINYSIPINFKSLPKGNYYLQIMIGTTIDTIQLIVE